MRNLWPSILWLSSNDMTVQCPQKLQPQLFLSWGIPHQWEGGTMEACCTNCRAVEQYRGMCSSPSAVFRVWLWTSDTWIKLEAGDSIGWSFIHCPWHLISLKPLLPPFYYWSVRWMSYIVLPFHSFKSNPAHINLNYALHFWLNKYTLATMLSWIPLVILWCSSRHSIQ